MKTLNLKSVSTIILLNFLFCNALLAQGGYGEIRGLIKDVENELVPFATVKILQGNFLVGGTQTDAKGHYSYKPLNPGTYDLLVQEAGHQTQPVKGIRVTPNEATYVDVSMQLNTLATFEIIAEPINYDPTGVDKTMFSKVSFNAEELNQLAGYNRGDIKGSLEQVTSDVVTGSDGEVHFRGGRSDASAYYVDGVRTLGATTIPGLSIENLTVFSGGVPAAYGDVTSGVVVVTTKSYFSGIREKNMRVNAQRERREAEKKQKKIKEDEEQRKKEIEEEKAKEKKN